MKKFIVGMIIVFSTVLSLTSIHLYEGPAKNYLNPAQGCPDKSECKVKSGPLQGALILGMIFAGLFCVAGAGGAMFAGGKPATNISGNAIGGLVIGAVLGTALGYLLWPIFCFL